ncbi:MAG: DUF5663 domain-containing protein [Candidatus Saccharibacteria bacterium]|nr:DUF5663 domain-containing protein [Candidatus Saccharibacteria bacterium]MCY4010778.1 DUF5663 domain-containing protein [Candidatus Saccharibacteria bacterium]MCY4088925.1 DUF5663 domain-containing protein [Candidatus Saccharibacteria bacterium]
MKLLALNNDFLKELGLESLPEAEKKELLIYIEEQLSLRVGLAISKVLSNQELAEFDQALQNPQKTPAQLIALLREKAPQYPKIVEVELERLKTEIVANTQQILNQAKS